MTKEELKKMPYVKSTKRQRISTLDRCAQFMPFAALTGHKEQIGETSRLTDSMIILDEYEKMDLNQKLNTILKLSHPLCEITYFVKDLNKDGGKYITVSKYIKKYDEFSKELLTDDGLKISVSDIVSLEHEIFNNFY